MHIFVIHFAALLWFVHYFLLLLVDAGRRQAILSFHLEKNNIFRLCVCGYRAFLTQFAYELHTESVFCICNLWPGNSSSSSSRNLHSAKMSTNIHICLESHVHGWRTTCYCCWEGIATNTQAIVGAHVLPIALCICYCFYCSCYWCVVYDFEIAAFGVPLIRYACVPICSVQKGRNACMRV